MTGNLPFCTVLIFSQASFRSDRYGASARLRDDALPVQLGGVLKHLLTVAGEMFRVEDREFNVVLAEKIQQRLLALDLRELAEVAIPPEEIEGVVDEPALPARGEFCLEFGKVGASLMDDHHLAVDDGFAWNGERAGNLGKALGPVQPVAGEHLLSSAVEMDLDAIAVVLDFMKPLLALGRLGLQRGKLGLNEPRHG